MVAEFSAALTSVKAALDIVNGLNNLRREADIKSAIADLTNALMDAQLKTLDAYQQQTTLLDRMRELEGEIATFEKWDTEVERYELSDIGNGVVTFVLKEEAESGEISHKLCPDCFEQRTKSYLQIEAHMPGRSEVAVCNRCGLEAYRQGFRRVEHGPPRRRPTP